MNNESFEKKLKKAMMKFSKKNQTIAQSDKMFALI